jgi:DNA-binding GntR family transcriptional regulator
VYLSALQYSLTDWALPQCGHDRGVLDRDSPVPLHTQLADALRAKIRSGEISGRVPSILTVAQTYQVGHSTAQHALASLRDEGLIVGSHGKGYFVAR